MAAGPANIRLDAACKTHSSVSGLSSRSSSIGPPARTPSASRPRAGPQPVAGEDAPHAADVAGSAADEVRLRRRSQPVLPILDDQCFEGGEALEEETRGPRVGARGVGDGLGVGGAFGHVIEDAELESGAQDGAPQEAERHGDVVVGALRLGEERALKLVAGRVRFRRRHGIQPMRAPRVPQGRGRPASFSTAIDSACT